MGTVQACVAVDRDAAGRDAVGRDAVERDTAGVTAPVGEATSAAEAAEPDFLKGQRHPDWVRPLQGTVTTPVGFTAAGVHCGVKKSRNDLALVVSERPASAAGMFTTNRVKAWPVLLSMAVAQRGVARAVVANSGNANACTGFKGKLHAEVMAQVAGEHLGGVDPGLVVVASTGVIGVELPIDRVVNGIAQASSQLSRAGGHDAACAIMTTDTFPKEAACQVDLGDSVVTVAGCAKGSGMIHPDMATMLSFVTTDAAISPAALREALRHAVGMSFNMITVDGDTSTNDMVFALASGLGAAPAVDGSEESLGRFRDGLTFVCERLAMMIARDGEGATRLVQVDVRGAPTPSDAARAARTVAGSNLVKTAIHGNDANWGRILAALGRSGVEIDPDRIDLRIGDVAVARGGRGLPFDEDAARHELSQPRVVIDIDLGIGSYRATAYGCDMSPDYVRVNASYRS